MIVPLAILFSTARVVPQSTQVNAANRVPEFGRYARAMGTLGMRGVLLVAQHGKIVFNQGIGGLRADALFDIASIAKSITAAEILKMVGAGKIRLDAKLPEFFTNVPEDKKEITVAQLLRHLSGIGNSSGDTAQGVLDREKAVQMILATPLVGKPGEKFSYSNDGYTILAAILEVISGRTWESLMRSDILEPAAMKQTLFLGASLKGMSSVAPGLTQKVNTADWGGKGGAGILSTAGDLARFQFALTGGKLIGKAALDSLHVVPAPGRLFRESDAFTVWAGRQGGSIWIHGGADTGPEHYSQFAYFVDQDALIVSLGVGDEAMADAFALGAQRVLFGATPADLPVHQAPIESKPSVRSFAEGGWRFDVKFDEKGIAELDPIGQPATALLSCLDEQQQVQAGQTNDLATRFLKEVSTGRRPESASLAQKEIAEYLKSAIEREGNLTSIDMLGTAPNWTDPSDSYLTFARANFAKRSVIFRLYWKGSTLLARGGSVYPNPAPTPLVRVDSVNSIGWNPSIGVLSHVRIDRNGLTLRVGRRTVHVRAA